MSERVSDEAVDAAWATMWDVPYIPTCNATRKEVRKALEAAAPYLMAQAWDEGKSAGWDAARGEPEESNPYHEGAGMSEREYQARSIIFQWKNGAMSDREALERLDRLYAISETR